MPVCDRKSDPGDVAPSVISPVAVECRDVEKHFHYYEQRTTTLREGFVRLLSRKPVHIRRPAFVLDGVSLHVSVGQSVGIVGNNGSGKSSLLRLISGIYKPTSGTVYTRGRIGVVMGLGTGFHPDLTGTENVAIYAAIMRISRKQLVARLDDIVEFSGIGDFIHMPVKYYSSGMVARLAFAVTVCVEPDILVLDEVLAVGDATFREKCLTRLEEFHAAGGTMIIASHSLAMVQSLCSRALWLDNGSVRMDGDAEAVCQAYSAAAQQPDQTSQSVDPPLRKQAND